MYHYEYIDNQADSLILITHGLMGHVDEFRPITNALTKYNWILLDLPGHGKNRLAPCDKNILFTFLTNLMQEYKIDIFWGYSMGGRILLEFLHYHASSFPTKMIIESANPFALNSHENSLRHTWEKSLFSQIKTQQDLDAFFINWYSMPIFGNFIKTTQYQKLIKTRTLKEVPYWEKALHTFSITKQPNCQNFRPEINYLFISGTQDKKYNQIGKHLSKQHNIPHIEISQAAHNLHITHRNLLIDTLSIKL